MIEKMKKITLVVTEKERESALLKLREAGVMHIKSSDSATHHGVKFTEEKIKKVERLKERIGLSKENKIKHGTISHEKEIINAADKIEELFAEKQGLLKERENLDNQIDCLAEWGDVDPEDIRAIEDKGYDVVLRKVPKREEKERKKDSFVFGKDRGQIKIASIVKKGNTKIEEKILLPEKNKKALEKEKIEIINKTKDIDNFFQDAAKSITEINMCQEKLCKELEFMKVKFGMGEEERFSYLMGYCPEKKLKKIIVIAENHGAGYIIDEPDNFDETPTLITNPKWIQIIDPVFNFMNTLPGYDEFDISFYFLIFFSLFFAMLIGDAGYGILFLGITFFAHKKFPKMPKEPFFLMYLLSFGTVIWGVITGTWFGSEQISQLPFLKQLIIPRLSSFGTDNQNLMIFICFTIGVIHLTIAHLLRAVRVINSIKCISEFGWILIVWGMYFTAGKFVIARPFPQGVEWLFIGGISSVLMFSQPEKGIIKGAAETLSNLPLSIISAFSDIVSYLRLFAVGYASCVVAESFNSMAIGEGINSIIGGVAAAIILFFGHLLNIILGFMAVVVHGIRLNMLEFSGHLGMQWSGKKYDPFR